MTAFDPDAAAAAGSGIFGLDTALEQAGIVLVPVPFAPTVSYGAGAERGPAAMLQASHQVDLYDFHFGRVYEAGIHLLAPDPEIEALHRPARQAAEPIIARGGAAAGSDEVAAVDRAGEQVNQRLRSIVTPLLADGRGVGVLGGDHSVPFAAIVAAAEREPLGILHVDAHMDLRSAYEGFRWSHASIMHNVLAAAPGVVRLVQVGIRDYGEGEHRAMRDSGGRIVTHFDGEWHRRRFAGEPFDRLVEEVLRALPERVWISFDIDGLDPSLCPNTGTPVPGGLQYQEAVHLLVRLAESGRELVGFDLVEVAPGRGEWDANVGARILYKLCGALARGRRGPG